MFRAQDLAMPINPAASPQLYCGYAYYSYCGWNYYSYCGYAYYSYCGWNYFSHCGYYYHTFVTLPQVQQVCPAITAIPGQVGPGDPVEGLQALRKQLELALASVEAQERVLQEHRGRQGEAGEAARGKTPERKG